MVNLPPEGFNPVNLQRDLHIRWISEETKIIAISPKRHNFIFTHKL
jgi:hypothetical protein